MNNYYNRSPRSHCNLLVKSENIVMGEFPPKCTDLKNQEIPYVHFCLRKLAPAAVLYDMLAYCQTFQPNIFHLQHSIRNCQKGEVHKIALHYRQSSKQG